MNKKIHFYTYEVKDKYLPKILSGFNETRKAIEEDCEEICTTQMILLDTSLIEKGYEIWIHEEKREPYYICQNKKFPILLDCDIIDKQLKVSHCLYRFWLGGGFN